MKVSIIVPLYRITPFINQCLTSLNAHTNNEDTEIIIVRSSGSFAENCNRGIKIAKGEYICLLNDDILVTENWLSPLISVLDSRPDAGGVSPMMLFPTKKVQFAGMVFHSDYMGGHLGWGWSSTDPRLPKEVTEFQATTFGCVLLRKSALPLSLEDKPIDECYRVGGYEDIDTCFRMRKQGWRFFLQPASKIEHWESTTFNNMDQKVRTEASNKNREIYLNRWKPSFERGILKVDDVNFSGGVWKGFVDG